MTIDGERELMALRRKNARLSEALGKIAAEHYELRMRELEERTERRLKKLEKIVMSTAKIVLEANDRSKRCMEEISHVKALLANDVPIDLIRDVQRRLFAIERSNRKENGRIR